MHAGLNAGPVIFIAARLISFLLKLFLRTWRLMAEDEDDRARAERCLQLAREASTLETRHRWVKQAEFWFSLSERDTGPANQRRQSPVVID
jgi:hypothetical protein